MDQELDQEEHREKDRDRDQAKKLELIMTQETMSLMLNLIMELVLDQEREVSRVHILASTTSWPSPTLSPTIATPLERETMVVALTTPRPSREHNVPTLSTDLSSRSGLESNSSRARE